VEKVAAIGCLEVMVEMCIGCDEDYVGHACFLCVGCLVTCSVGLGKRRWKKRRNAFLVMILEYQVVIFMVKTQGEVRLSRVKI
jgi:uncharacterized Fe-S center protein